MLKVQIAKNKMENEEGMNHLLVEVEPEVIKENVEKPIAFMLVLDVSGSMNGHLGNRNNEAFRNFQYHKQPFSNQQLMGVFQESYKSEYITKLGYVKQASERLIDMMKDGNQLGIVSFSDIASLEYPLTTLNKDERFELKKRINSLCTKGMTNVSDGLELAYRQIPESLRKTHHIKLILLSDGQANFGIRDVDGIATLVSEYRNNDVSISTIGVGADYNSYYMESIATASGGMFYHLQDMTQLNEIFTQELETLTTLTTKQATIKIKVPEGIKTEKNMNGFQEENIGEIFIGNVFSKQKVLVELSTVEKVPVGKRTITVSFEYVDNKGERKIIEETVNLHLCKEEEIENVETNKEVVDLVKQFIEAKAQQEALRSYEVGDITNATFNMTNSIQKLSKASSFYEFDATSEIKSMSLLNDQISSMRMDKETSKRLYSSSYNDLRNKKDTQD